MVVTSDFGAWNVHRLFRNNPPPQKKHGMNMYVYNDI